jgi:tRNA pseudouridine38-40 synthase
MHDFQSFADRDKEDKSTKVLIEDVEVKEWGDLILIRITGSHFLWKMVRRVTGVLIETGRGKLRKTDIIRFLETKTNEPAKYTAPPSGLFLETIQYVKQPLQELMPVQIVNKFED